MGFNTASQQVLLIFFSQGNPRSEVSWDEVEGGGSLLCHRSSGARPGGGAGTSWRTGTGDRTGGKKYTNQKLFHPDLK